jgi:hypothetical protein
MTKGKRLALRLALYLSSIDIPLTLSASSYKQWAETLQAQYDALDAEQRELAETIGRRLIKESTSITKAASVLPTPVFIQTRQALRLSSHERAHEKSNSNSSPGGAQRSRLLVLPVG